MKCYCSNAKAMMLQGGNLLMIISPAIEIRISRASVYADEGLMASLPYGEQVTHVGPCYARNAPLPDMNEVHLAIGAGVKDDDRPSRRIRNEACHRIHKHYLEPNKFRWKMRRE